MKQNRHDYSVQVKVTLPILKFSTGFFHELMKIDRQLTDCQEPLAYEWQRIVPNY